MTYLDDIESPLAAVYEAGDVKDGDLGDVIEGLDDHPSFKDMVTLEWGSIFSQNWEKDGLTAE